MSNFKRGDSVWQNGFNTALAIGAKLERKSSSSKPHKVEHKGKGYGGEMLKFKGRFMLAEEIKETYFYRSIAFVAARPGWFKVAETLDKVEEAAKEIYPGAKIERTVKEYEEDKKGDCVRCSYGPVVKEIYAAANMLNKNYDNTATRLYEDVSVNGHTYIYSKQIFKRAYDSNTKKTTYSMKITGMKLDGAPAPIFGVDTSFVVQLGDKLVQACGGLYEINGNGKKLVEEVTRSALFNGSEIKKDNYLLTRYIIAVEPGVMTEEIASYFGHGFLQLDGKTYPDQEMPTLTQLDYGGFYKLTDVENGKITIVCCIDHTHMFKIPTL